MTESEKQLETLGDVIQAFNLKSTDAEEVLKELEGLRNDAHPDRSGTDSSERFTEVAQAIDFVKTLAPSTDLVPVADRALLSTLIASQKAAADHSVALLAIQERQLSEQRTEKLEKAAETAIRHSVNKTWPRQVVPSGLVILLGGFFVTFGEKFTAIGDLSAEADPHWAATVNFVGGLIMLFGLLVGFAGALQIHRFKEKQLTLLSEGTFFKFLSSEAFGDAMMLGDQDDTIASYVSLETLAEASVKFGKIDESAADEVAAVMMQRLLDRKLAVPSDGPSISPTVQIDETWCWRLDKHRRKAMSETSPKLQSAFQKLFGTQK